MSAELPTFHQVSEQQEAGLKDMTVLVERSGDKISTGQYRGERLANGNYAVHVTMANGQEGFREVTKDALSDAKQAELAEALSATRAESQILPEVGEDTLKRSTFKEIGHDALGASGIESPAPELSSVDKILDKAPVLRMFEADLKSIAKMRRREEGEGHRHGMSQFDSSERMIDDLLKLANQVEKSKISEDRRGAVYRYIDQV